MKVHKQVEQEQQGHTMAEKTTNVQSAKLRKQIFLAVVEEQDLNSNTLAARKTVAERFGISEDAVRVIEEEGIQKDWPPLGDEPDRNTKVRRMKRKPT